MSNISFNTTTGLITAVTFNETASHNYLMFNAGSGLISVGGEFEELGAYPGNPLLTIDRSQSPTFSLKVGSAFDAKLLADANSTIGGNQILTVSNFGPR